MRKIFLVLILSLGSIITKAQDGYIYTYYPSGKVDGVIFVVRANETNRNAVLKSKEMLENVKMANHIGVVLNMVDVDRTGGHYYYYHYYGKKYGHYGRDTDV